MPDLGKVLFFAGILLAVVGLLIWKVGFGSLPGDLVLKKGPVTLYFPIISSLIASALLTLIFWLLRR